MPQPIHGPIALWPDGDGFGMGPEPPSRGPRARDGDWVCPECGQGRAERFVGWRVGPWPICSTCNSPIFGTLDEARELDRQRSEREQWRGDRSSTGGRSVRGNPGSGRTPLR